MKIYLVSDNVDTLVGMRLAGIEGCVVHEQGELKKAIDHALEDKEIGILLLTEKFGREYPELINKVKLDHKLPLIIEVPDRHGTGRKPDFITSYGNQKLAHEHLVNKRALSQKETEFKDKLFQEVAALVEAYKKTPEYVQVIKKQIIDAKSFAKNDDIIIYLDPADASKKHDLEEETKCTLTMSEYSFGGGMRAVIPARSILIDNSMDSRIAEVRNEFQFDGGEYDGR